MNLASDARLLAGLGSAQRGVFSLDDLETALAEKHRAALFRRIEQLMEAGELVRFTRGFYVAREFDVPTLSQRISPDSAISFEWVLAENLVIGPRPAGSVTALRSARSRSYSAAGATVEFRQVAARARFGEELRDGLRRTCPEKAMLDVLAFHLRGRRALFDIYGDADLSRLDSGKLESFLGRYRNPKFVVFVRDVLELR